MEKKWRWSWMAEHLLMEQMEWDGMEWKQVDVENGMDAHKE